MTNQHTEENKLAVCPYCQISLDTVVYWEHLEEHMGSTATVRTTPTKPVVPTQNQQESCSSGIKKNLSTIESKDSTSNQTPSEAPNQGQIETSTKAETIPSVSESVSKV